MAKESPGCAVEAWEIAELLPALVDKSLVVFDESTGRYQLLETMRQYARGRMAGASEEETWQDRHLLHFMALAKEAESYMTGSEQLHWLARLDAEHDNIRTALDWSIGGSDDPAIGMELAGSMWRYWQARGHIAEGRGWLMSVLTAGGENIHSAARADALEGAGVLAWRQGDYLVARQLHEASIAIRRSLNDQIAVASSLCNLGLVAWQLGDHEKAIALHRESLELRRQVGDKLGIADSLNILGTAFHEQGDFASAQALHEESLAIAKDLGNSSITVMCLIDLGNAALEMGAYETARDRYGESLSMLGVQRDRLRIAQTLEGCAHLASVLNLHHNAAAIWGAADRMREEIAAPTLLHERTRLERNMGIARSSCGDPNAFDEAWEKGRSMGMEEAIELALHPVGD